MTVAEPTPEQKQQATVRKPRVSTASTVINSDPKLSKLTAVVMMRQNKGNQISLIDLFVKFELTE